ncbi:hypothetical protein ACIRU3_47365 [Streptomyces sp. NPDC101151]
MVGEARHCLAEQHWQALHRLVRLRADIHVATLRNGTFCGSRPAAMVN